MVGGVIIALYGALLGWLFGRLEAQETLRRIRNKDAAKLPHAVLLILRSGMLAVVCNWIGGAEHWAPLILFVIGSIALASTHRVTYNVWARRLGVSVVREWWYMGSCRRYIDDSWYDTLWWVLSAMSIRICKLESGKRYLLIRPRSYALPFILVASVELIALAIALALYWRQTITP